MHTCGKTRNHTKWSLPPRQQDGRRSMKNWQQDLKKRTPPYESLGKGSILQVCECVGVEGFITCVMVRRRVSTQNVLGVRARGRIGTFDMSELRYMIKHGFEHVKATNGHDCLKRWEKKTPQHHRTPTTSKVDKKWKSHFRIAHRLGIRNRIFA